MPIRALSLDGLADPEFEEFCFDLLVKLGFVNVDWRKGTGLDTSPADSGRDIVAQLVRKEVDGSTHIETWFIDCKHHKRGVPPDKLQSLLTWAEAEDPHVALVIASNFLSNPAKDWLAAYERNRRPRFKIKHWERPTIERLVGDDTEFLGKYLLGEGVRREDEILAAEQEFFDRIWYNRHQGVIHRHDTGERVLDPALLNTATEAAARIEERMGKESLGPHDDFEWGMLNGKLSALRWVLGEEWDFLDT